MTGKCFKVPFFTAGTWNGTDGFGVAVWETGVGDNTGR